MGRKGAGNSLKQGPIDEKEHASKLFKANKRKVEEFTMIDPFNACNTVSGYINQSDGPEGGSIAISEINKEKLKELRLIHGTPKLHYPYKNYETYEWKNFNVSNKDKENGCLDHVVISNKWNGTNILFFIYKDENNRVYLSAKTKGKAFLQNNRYSPLLNLTLKALGIPDENASSTDKALNGCFIEDNEHILREIPFLKYWIEKIKNVSNEWQSISCELCGRLEPHLVKYDFDLKLYPLFIQNFDGSIVPIQLFAKDMEQEHIYNAPDVATIIKPVTNVKDLHNQLGLMQKRDLEQNEK
jgi:hypothetical protein